MLIVWSSSDWMERGVILPLCSGTSNPTFYGEFSAATELFMVLLSVIQWV
jgi:hypothetical protein